MSASGGRTATTTAAMTITEAAKTRPAATDSLIRPSVNPRSCGHPQIAPVFPEQRPQHLIHVLSAAPDRLTQHAFLNRSELAKRAVGAPIPERYTRLEPM